MISSGLVNLNPNSSHSAALFDRNSSPESSTTMARMLVTLLLAILLLGLMMESTMADFNHQQQAHNRRLLQSATPLPAFKSRNVCGGLGPVCPSGVHIECAVGGKVGCICSLVRTCQPTVSGCTLIHGASKTPCGF